MSLSAKLRRAPLRVVTGAFILNSGVTKLGADEQTAQSLQGMAAGTYPFLGKVAPKLFVKGLGAGEIAVGSALLLPFVSPVVAGGALLGFSGAILNLYWNTPGMHPDGDPRPTQQGVPIAKDIWLAGIGASLILDGIVTPAHDKKVEIVSTLQEKGNRNAKKRRKARKAAKKSAIVKRDHFVEAAKDTSDGVSRRARRAANSAAERARQSDAPAQLRTASERASARLAGARDEYAPVVVDRAKQAREAARNAIDEYGPVVADKAKQARVAARDVVDEYGPVVADKAKQAREAAADLRDEYGPVVADKAKQARDVARGAVDEYAPVVADKAKQARVAAADLRDEYAPVVADRAKQAREAAADLRDEYGPAVAEKAKQARLTAQDAAARAQAAGGKAKARVAG